MASGRNAKCAEALSKNHAAPQPRVPAESAPAKHRGRPNYSWSRSYDDRSGCDDRGGRSDSRSRKYDSPRCNDGGGRSYNNRGAGYDHDPACVRAASFVRTAMKARAASSLGTSTVEGDE